MQQVAEAGRGAEEGSLRETRGNKSAFSGSRLCPNSALASHHPRGRGRRGGEAARSAYPAPHAGSHPSWSLGECRAAEVTSAPRPAPPSWPGSAASVRVWAHAPRSPARGSRPRGSRAGPWSDRRGRDRPRPQPPALLSPRPLPGEGAVGQAWPLSPPRGQGPPPLRQPRDPYPAARLPTAEAHRRAGDMGGAPPPSSAVSSRDPVVPLPPAPRSPVSPGPQTLARPALPNPRCSGLPSCAPLPSRSPARALMSGTRLFPLSSFDAGARAPSFPPAPFPRAEPPAPAHPPLPPASRGPAEFPAFASPVACRPHLPQPCPDTTLAAPTATGRAYLGETLPRPPAFPPCPALLALAPRTRGVAAAAPV